MLVTFKSGAAADVIMFGDSARHLLRVLGKDPDAASGIVTVDQLPDAIATLRSAIADDKAHHAPADAEPADEEAPSGMNAPVSFAQRAWPVLEMLEYSEKEHKPVTWGV